MLILAGAPALSEFRIAKLVERLKAIDARITGLRSRYVHAVQVSRPLEVRERRVLEALLTYGPRMPDAEGAAAGLTILVAPRAGTTSPWSSKATDIAHVCGLDAVLRIERAIDYTLCGREDVSTAAEVEALAAPLHDRMVESALREVSQLERLFELHPARPIGRVEIPDRNALVHANSQMGLALSDDEIDYLLEAYERMGRAPTDAELMMFAQANSEHCRHKIFNADWIIDGEKKARSLFAMIRHTHAMQPDGVLSAYRDNAAVIAGTRGQRYFPDPVRGIYGGHVEPIDILIKVETHNHPTAISPFPGASTGSGGEIRDEGATGRGAKPKAGLVGFSVSHLRLPELPQPWELPFGKPERIASALDIMLEGPIGAASFNNEFGRPAIAGYFRTFEQRAAGDGQHVIRGYHKPIMIAGGLGNVRRQHVEKSEVPVGALIVVLGGPAMLIGLGGGAASSVGSGTSSAALDFASVQRGNPEIQRRVQEVIDRCWALGEQNPIQLIHDVGAGGLSNAVPEVVAHSHRGAQVELRDIPNEEPGMSPMEIWCNEAQERYVLTIAPESLARFAAIAERERAPFAVIGTIDDTGRLRVTDRLLGPTVIDMPIDVLLGKPPRLLRDVKSVVPASAGLSFAALHDDPLHLREAVLRVLQFPAVADKGFLVTIGDRSVGGLISRDQMVGPWQVPVADVAVTISDYVGYAGEAMAMGERTPVAVLDAPASGRLAIAESVLNLLAADVAALTDIRLSANWMAACGEPGEDAALYATVRAVAEELCPALGIAIPVGKDSLSMRTAWEDRKVVAPVSLIVSAFAPVNDVRRTLTPQLRLDAGDTRLLLVELGGRQGRLGASAYAQVFAELGATPADLDDPVSIARFAEVLRSLRSRGLVLAYHDRSDGGLIVTLFEMAFAARCGLEIELPSGRGTLAGQLFSEEPGVVLQVRSADVEDVIREFRAFELETCVLAVGAPLRTEMEVRVRCGRVKLDFSWRELREAWSRTSREMRLLRDEPKCALEEFGSAVDEADPGLHEALAFDSEEDISAPFIASGARPAVAVLREQGVNSHVEMAAVLEQVGFEPHDVHMTDLLAGRSQLSRFRGLVVCGGFSYGDVLGAGEGWAKSILFHSRLREEFARFFARPDAFTLGVCNGCQMMAALKELVPGAGHWPRFVRNRSEQFEGRFSLVEILPSPSVLLRGMEGSRLPIAVAHGEGRAEFASDAAAEAFAAGTQTVMRFIDNRGRVASRYPANPNGSPYGIAAITNDDGRVTLTMPHPERSFRVAQNSWHPQPARAWSGWMRLFRNARVWVG